MSKSCDSPRFQANGILPCATCPWRIEKDASTIPRYVHEKACNLTSTVGPGDGFYAVMACHHSHEDNNQVCNGYLAREGWRNINVRLMLSRGEIASPDLILSECQRQGIRLHRTFNAMLAKLKRNVARTAR